MSSTIEKALQRQQQEQARKKAEQEGTTSLERAVSAEKAKKSSDAPTENPPKAVAESSQATESVERVVQPEREPDNKQPFHIDLQRLEANGHISLTGERKQINEEYREIKRKLLSNAFGPLAKTLHNSNIIMVTSGRPSEGKTFTATNLAMSIAAEQDKTVLLVDADVLKPNVLNTLGLERRRGLVEYLSGEVADIADVLYPTNIDKLKIIPAGKSHHLTTELLASQKMHETVDEFANRYPDRIVIFDTPPLIGITETAVLANFAGQAVVVTEEGKSKIPDIRHCVDRLNPDMAIGFVVNKSVNQDTEGTGYYGYYYAERKS
ncbi:XrtA-associated tyrosine autokinase [Alteromonas sp. ASW11-19]|uniref:non-specific protein-tyrosine kinase n=1 Tax=Alteromonas salexigens TaxID=2982530 RepID=A0ABT2VT49_9ALTE|nr:XrtA-associated tyrosine autokinase [Alteromonas salexigens]MCU7555613.1 XrtA-associated tyrosine autokinase [Alteromonas salexigens]